MASGSNLHVETGAADPFEATCTDDRTLDSLVDEAVRCLVGGISERFVPQPNNEQRTINMIDGMGDFKSACRWREFWRNRNIERAETEQTTWAAYYHDYPEKLSQRLWDQSRTDPN